MNFKTAQEALETLRSTNVEIDDTIFIGSKEGGWECWSPTSNNRFFGVVSNIPLDSTTTISAKELEKFCKRFIQKWKKDNPDSQCPYIFTSGSVNSFFGRGMFGH